MGKQINFYAAESDNTFIINVLMAVFDVPIEAPYNFDDGFQSLEKIINNPRCYITELSRKQDVLYEVFEFDNNTKEKLINYRKSPVLEYCTATKNTEECYYGLGRFYCCTEDKEFSKKVSRFFTKFKKEFRYVKKWKIYVSKNIDIENSLFFIPNRTIKISNEDLEIK